MILENGKMTPRLFKLAIFFCITLLNLKTALASEQNIASAINLQPFEWNQDMCYCKGNLDASKLPAETATLIINRLENFKLNREIPLNKLIKYSKTTLEDERDLSINEYKTNIAKMEALNVPENPALLKYIKDRIFEEKIIHFLYISKINYLITASSKDLEQELEGRNHLNQCGKYSEILSSTEKIIDALPSFIEEQCINNSNEQTCTYNMFKRTAQIRNAKMEILTYGWQNCVNRFYREIQPPNYEEAFKAVKQYTSNLICECEDSGC